METAYHLAQRALADLKGAIYLTLTGAGNDGLTNAEIGKSLGIYAGHVGHKGHIPRTLLAVMEAEGVVEQDPDSKRWRIRRDWQPEAPDGDPLPQREKGV